MYVFIQHTNNKTGFSQTTSVVYQFSVVWSVSKFMRGCFIRQRVVHNVWFVGRPRLVWSPESCVTAAQCSCARMMRWKAKVASSLTDVWQQLFEQQDITVICTIHFHLWLHENHTSAPAPRDTNSNRHTWTCLSETSEGRHWAEALAKST